MLDFTSNFLLAQKNTSMFSLLLSCKTSIALRNMSSTARSFSNQIESLRFSIAEVSFACSTTSTAGLFAVVTILVRVAASKWRVLCCCSIIKTLSDHNCWFELGAQTHLEGPPCSTVCLQDMSYSCKCQPICSQTAPRFCRRKSGFLFIFSDKLLLLFCESWLDFISSFCCESCNNFYSFIFLAKDEIIIYLKQNQHCRPSL